MGESLKLTKSSFTLLEKWAPDLYVLHYGKVKNAFVAFCVNHSQVESDCKISKLWKTVEHGS